MIMTVKCIEGGEDLSDLRWMMIILTMVITTMYVKMTMNTMVECIKGES